MENDTQDIQSIVREEIVKFCNGFLKDPYLCYTEHGIHAYFYTHLYNRLRGKNITFKGKQVCIVQKEYPTENNLGRTKRQHWDIAIIQDPLPQNIDNYDRLPLACVIEFGLNEPVKHLENDVDRLSKANNVSTKFIVHLLRISNMFSGRDKTCRSKILEVRDENILKNKEMVNKIKKLEIYIVVCSIDSKIDTEAFVIKEGSRKPL